MALLRSLNPSSTMDCFHLHLTLLLTILTPCAILQAEPAQTSKIITKAMMLYTEGKFEEAEKACRFLVVEYEQTFGKEHPETLAQKNNLANLLTAEGHAAEGERGHREILAIRERLFGADHADAISSRNNLAVALQAQGKSMEAEKEFRTVLTARQHLLAPQDPDVLKTYYALALCLDSQSRYGEAIIFAGKALSGWENVRGSDHPITVRARALRERIELHLNK